MTATQNPTANFLRLLVALGLLFFLPNTASAQYTLNYQTNGEEVVVTGYSGSPVNITIPDFVTSIGMQAFSHCTSLTNVIIPNNVFNIGAEAFLNCLALANVTIGDGTTNIGEDAFWYCTNLSNVAIGDGLTTLTDYAFGFCTSLTNVVVGKSLTFMGAYVFEECTNLAIVFFSGNAPYAEFTEFRSDFTYDPVTVFYLYGTTGWDYFPARTGVPAVLLNPPISPQASSIDSQKNQFGFTITGPTNQTVIVQSCADLGNPIWMPVQTNTLTNGSLYFSDTAWKSHPNQFYRVQYPLP